VTTSAYESALRQLPSAYAQVLRLTDADATDEEICSRLGIEPEGLDTLVELARRKLQRELTQR
jgi:DNA-directed RNA polymerase specialized sigma24 family protein